MVNGAAAYYLLSADGADGGRYLYLNPDGPGTDGTSDNTGSWQFSLKIGAAPKVKRDPSQCAHDYDDTDPDRPRSDHGGTQVWYKQKKDGSWVVFDGFMVDPVFEQTTEYTTEWTTEYTTDDPGTGTVLHGPRSSCPKFSLLNDVLVSWDFKNHFQLFLYRP